MNINFTISQSASQNLLNTLSDIVKESFDKGIKSALDSIDTSKLNLKVVGDKAMEEAANTAAANKIINEGINRVEEQASGRQEVETIKGEQAKESYKEFMEAYKAAKREMDEESEGSAADQKRTNAFIKSSLSLLNTAAEGTKMIFKGSMELLEGIFEKMKAASPLLEAVEALFQLAMTLFFMPIGNKLGEILIPAVVELLDKVVSMWDSFEGKSLGAIVGEGIHMMVGYLGDFFNDIGDTLEAEGGMVGNIGHMLNSIGNFLESNGADVISKMVDFASLVVENFKTIASLIIGFETAYLTLEIAGAAGLFGGDLAQAAVATLIMGGIGFTAGEIGLSAAGFKDGGHVDPVPGGQVVRVAEEGEGEWMVPDSVMDKILGMIAPKESMPDTGTSYFPVASENDTLAEVDAIANAADDAYLDLLEDRTIADDIVPLDLLKDEFEVEDSSILDLLKDESKVENSPTLDLLGDVPKTEDSSILDLIPDMGVAVDNAYQDLVKEDPPMPEFVYKDLVPDIPQAEPTYLDILTEPSVDTSAVYQDLSAIAEDVPMERYVDLLPDEERMESVSYDDMLRNIMTPIEGIEDAEDASDVLLMPEERVAEASEVAKPPEMKVENVFNNTWNLNGYTNDDLRYIIKDAMDEEISRSRIRNPF